MGVITVLLYVYGILGFIYALYVLISGGSPWYLFPINVMGGPIVVVYNIVKLIFVDSRKWQSKL